MKIAVPFLVLLAAATAHAQPGDGDFLPGPPPEGPSADAPTPPPAARPPGPAYAYPEPSVHVAPPSRDDGEEDTGWKRPAGRRLLHGFRIGWTYVMNYDKPTRADGSMSLAQEFDLKTPNMMLLGYEGFYRIVGHSWLNVLMVGNVSVAGLEQSKFIPAASGLLGFELNQSFQLGVGVNLTPDPESPSHMIAAAGWTPKVGAIHTPVHFFFVPDTERNHRMGATIGMTW